MRCRCRSEWSGLKAKFGRKLKAFCVRFFSPPAHKHQIGLMERRVKRDRSVWVCFCVLVVNFSTLRAKQRSGRGGRRWKVPFGSFYKIRETLCACVCVFGIRDERLSRKQSVSENWSVLSGSLIKVHKVIWLLSEWNFISLHSRVDSCGCFTTREERCSIAEVHERTWSKVSPIMGI